MAVRSEPELIREIERLKAELARRDQEAAGKERQLELHPVIGDEILRGIEFLGEARLIVRSHHERWDGAGYPDRLQREQIPLAARVFAVADVLDALTSDRPYRLASDLPVAREMILAE